jgi:hypothetical protein
MELISPDQHARSVVAVAEAFEEATLPDEGTGDLGERREQP